MCISMGSGVSLAILLCWCYMFVCMYVCDIYIYPCVYIYVYLLVFMRHTCIYVGEPVEDGDWGDRVGKPVAGTVGKT